MNPMRAGSKGVHFHWMYLFTLVLAAVCLANQELLHEAKQYHQQLRTLTELSSNGKSKYCYFGSTARYEVGQSFTPHLLPSGYAMCITCTCNADGNVTCYKDKCSKCLKTPHHLKRTDCCKKCLAIRSKKRKPCVHEGATYQHEEVWKFFNTHDTTLRPNECEECSCINGQVTCAFRVCPVTNCTKPKTQPGTCCKTCADSSTKTTAVTKSGCWSMGRVYEEGETWHPILSPRDKPARCVLCSCRNAKIDCRVPSCPKLLCSVGVREKNTDCCLKCAETSSETKDVQPTTVEPVAVTVPAWSKDCVQYNKVYKNGSTFHPDVHPFGVQHCVTCSCKNTVVRCKRVNCTEICQKGDKEDSECCKDCHDPTKSVYGSKTANKRSKRVDCSTPKNEPISVYKYSKSKRPNKRRYEVEIIAIVDSENKAVNITTWATTSNAKVISTKETLRLERFQAIGKYERVGKMSREKVRKFDELSLELKLCTSGCLGKLRRVMNTIHQLTKLPGSCKISQEGSFRALIKLKED